MAVKGIEEIDGALRKAGELGAPAGGLCLLSGQLRGQSHCDTGCQTSMRTEGQRQTRVPRPSDSPPETASCYFLKVPPIPGGQALGLQGLGDL